MGILNSSLPGVGGVPLVMQALHANRDQRNQDALTRFQQAKGIMDIKNAQEQMALAQAQAPAQRKLMEAQAWSMTNPGLEVVDEGHQVRYRDRRTGQTWTQKKGTDPSTALVESGKDRRHDTVSADVFATNAANERIAAMKANATAFAAGMSNQGKFLENNEIIRKTVDNAPEVKNFRNANSMYLAALEAAKDNSKAADIDMIYAFGKIMDPASAVREGELALAMNSESPVYKTMMSFYNMVTNGQGLTAAARQNLLNAMQRRIGSMQQGYDKTINRARNIGKAAGIYGQGQDGSEFWDIGIGDAAMGQEMLRGYIKDSKVDKKATGPGTPKSGPKPASAPAAAVPDGFKLD